MYGVIDIGSNSVRLMLHDGIKTLKKENKITKLAEGLSDDLALLDGAIERTALAVSFFVDLAKNSGADTIYIFGTAAVRRAKNSNLLTEKIYSLTAINVDIISGEMEAEIGAIGGLLGKDGGIIDVGGASTEIRVQKDNECIYGKSIDLGCVRVLTECGQDYKKAEEYITSKVEEFGCVPNTNFVSLGGTATSIGSIIQKFKVYNPQKNDGFKVKIKKLKKLTKRLYNMPVEKRKSLKGLQPERAEVIAGGCLILLKIMQKYKIKYFAVSERDNLEGYLIKKLRKGEIND